MKSRMPRQFVTEMHCSRYSQHSSFRSLISRISAACKQHIILHYYTIKSHSSPDILAYNSILYCIAENISVIIVVLKGFCHVHDGGYDHVGNERLLILLNGMIIFLGEISYM